MSNEGWLKADTVLVATFIVLVSLALLAPMYKITTTTSYQNSGSSSTVTQFYYFDYTKIKTVHETEFAAHDSTKGIGDVLADEKSAMICSLVLGWIFLIILVFGDNQLRIIVGWMAMASSVISAGYPVVGIPGSTTTIDGFYGSLHEDLLTMSWGPSSGWYLVLIATVFIGFVALRRMNAYFREPHLKEEEEEAVPPVVDRSAEELLR